MVVCDACEGDSSNPDVKTCVPGLITVDDVDYEPIPYNKGLDGPERCHDCNVVNGAIHHPGCDMERCPACQGQYISCTCGAEHGSINVDGAVWKYPLNVNDVTKAPRSLR